MKNICFVSASINLCNFVKYKRNRHKFFSKGLRTPQSPLSGIRRDIMPACREHESVFWSRGFIHHQPSACIGRWLLLQHVTYCCCCCWACMQYDGINLPMKFFSESIVHSSCVSFCVGPTKQASFSCSTFVCVALTMDIETGAPFYLIQGIIANGWMFRIQEIAALLDACTCCALVTSNFGGALIFASGSRPQY